ncbi:MAG: PRD domain-containing protein [Lachnospiraceae bacterium]|nr:PRD domain-containing protein [Lachnospiraceae bacterium]
MEVLKVINNNIVVSLDENQKEAVVMGRGLGFKKKAGDLIEDTKIEKTFTINDEKSNTNFQKLVNDIKIERIHVADEIIEYAKKSLQKELSDNIYVSLTDHINLAIERMEEGVEFQNPFGWEIKKFYYREYLIGKYAVNIIKKRLGVQLGEDEASFIALHIINAELKLDMSRMVSMTKMIQDILDIVEGHFKIRLNRNSIYFERFVRHLKFFSQRLFTGKTIYEDKSDDELLILFTTKYPDAYECTLKIKEYIYKTCGHTISNEEMTYITVHIKRLITDIEMD